MNTRQTEKAMTLIFAAVIITCIGSWIANIIKIFGLWDSALTGEFFLRAAGIGIVPLGVLTGFF